MDYGPAHAATRIAHARGGPRRGFSVIRNHLDESAQGNSELDHHHDYTSVESDELLRASQI
jgi:hypothetical protein